jgi:lysophospholipase L1-like esterase
MWVKQSTGGGSAPVDILYGKKIGIIGSSSSDVDRAGKNFWEHIADRTGCVLLDYADSGSKLTGLTTNYAADTTNQLKRIDELPIELDMVVVQPGANDANEGRPLGSFGSTSVTDYYGAMDTMCKKLYDKYPLLPFGVMTPQYFATPSAQTSVFHTATKEVCAFYNVPVCDLRSEGRVPYAYPAWQTVYAPDGWHLTEEGNMVLSRRVESFLRMLLGH